MSERSVYRMAGRKEDVSGISQRVARISVSAIKQMPVLASKVEGCISLGQGIPSFATPSFIIEGVIDALRRADWVGKYSLQPGLPALKQAVAKRLKETKGILVDPDTELFISCGAMEALAAGLATVVTVPGNGFGPTGEGHIRLSFGAAEKEIHEAFDRIESWAERHL